MYPSLYPLIFYEIVLYFPYNFFFDLTKLQQG